MNLTRLHHLENIPPDFVKFARHMEFVKQSDNVKASKLRLLNFLEPLSKLNGLF